MIYMASLKGLHNSNNNKRSQRAVVFIFALKTKLTYTTPNCINNLTASSSACRLQEGYENHLQGTSEPKCHRAGEWARLAQGAAESSIKART